MNRRLKTYHEWGYRFNESGRIQDLTRSQRQVIHLAEQAENYLKQQQQRAAQRGGKTQTGLENRASKQNRINNAIQKHTGES